MNADAIKDFLFRHVEKFVFAALTMLALFLIYQGVQKPDILATHQPDKMEQQANQVKTSIEDDHWSAIKEPRLPTFDIVSRTKESTKPVVPTPYVLPYTWEGKDFDLSVKRTDPKLPVPIELQVTGVVASLAYKSTGDYALKLLEPADPVVKDEKPKAPKPKRNRQMEAMMESMMDPSMMDPSMMDPSMMDPSMSGMGMSGMGAQMSGMGGGVAATPVRKVDAKLYDQGFRPVGVSEDVAPATGWFIAGVALMPQKEIYDAYEKAFAQADGYDPRRDQPYYLGFQLQRADVTNKTVDQLAPEDWTSRGTSRLYQQLLLKRWSGMAKEIVAGKYRDPELTAAIPPVLLDHYAWFAVHPKIPVGDEPLPGATSMSTVKDEEVSLEPIIPDAGGDDSFTGKGRAGGGSGVSGYGGMMDPSAGYGGYGGMTGYGAGTKVIQPDYKLIRFYDFHDFSGVDKGSPMPGRKYVYRIRIAVEDPNFPASAASQPRNSTLASDVYKRVEKLTAQSLELAKTNPLKSRNSSMWSEYSAPSAPVSLPGLFEAFAGPVDPGSVKVFPVDATTNVEFQSKPPKAKIVVTAWSPQYGVRLPIFQDVTRGSVVNKVGTIDVPDPVAMEVKKLPDATIKTSNVVLDITGGRPLGISPADNQTEPGVVLMFDPSGGLEVVDEIETQRSYRLYSYADEREK